MELATDKHQLRRMNSSVFKKTGWQEANVVTYQGRHHKVRFRLVNFLPFYWWLLNYHNRHAFAFFQEIPILPNICPCTWIEDSKLLKPDYWPNISGGKVHFL